MIRWLLVLSLIASPLKAQVWYGDTAWYREGRETRGFFYLDTTETIGWRKANPKLPWVIPIAKTLQLRDWWMETASCQNLSPYLMTYEKYRFFLINRETFGGKGPAQLGYYGYHLQDSLAIYVAYPKRNSKAVWMHEMSHALMLAHGEKPGHPWNRFGPWGCGLNYVGR